MRNKIYSILVAFIVCLNVQAKVDFNLEKAELAYTAGEYNTALEVYNSALDMGYESADLYYNVANCYFRKGELAASILNYERALKLDPSHEDAKHNLEFAQSRTVDNIDTLGSVFLVEWWNGFANISSALFTTTVSALPKAALQFSATDLVGLYSALICRQGFSAARGRCFFCAMAPQPMNAAFKEDLIIIIP